MKKPSAKPRTRVSRNPAVYVYDTGKIINII